MYEHHRALQIVVIATIALQRAPLVLLQGATSDNSSVCTGIFDFYFVLDSSESVQDHFHAQVVPFVRNVAQHFAEPNFRLAIVTFASTSKVHLNLTHIAQRDSFEAGMRSLREHHVGGSTFLAPALTDVNNLINLFGEDRASVILVITDGRLLDLKAAANQSRIARAKGSTIFAIGVGNRVRFSQLSSITNKRDQVRIIGSNFNFLNQAMNKVVNDTCLEITSVKPSTVCLGSNTTNVTLIGRGFTKQLVKGRAVCRFKSAYGMDYTIPPTESIEYDKIICPVPRHVNDTCRFLLQVAANGVSFISSNVTLTVSSCPTDVRHGNAAIIDNTSSKPALIAGIVLLLSVVLALLFALWYFFPLITCKIEGGIRPQTPSKKEEPRVKGSTPGRTWEVVDASYYGGRGAGGIRPMTVKWGEKGATIMGEKLEKAKEAKVITVKRESAPARPAPPPPRQLHHNKTPHSCWQHTKAKFQRWYTVLASYRPVFTVHGSARKIIWCSKTRHLSKNTAVAV